MTPRPWLKEWRGLLGFTQPQFARWIGVSRSTVARWEAGTQPVPGMLSLLWTCWLTANTGRRT